MMLLDSPKIILAMDALVTLTEFLHKESTKPSGEERFLPQEEDKKEEKVF